MTRQFKIGDFLNRIKNQIDIIDSVKYKRVTVSGNHRGVSLRDELIGSSIGTKRQFIIKGGDFILSKIDARNGAFGIIPQELDNAIITGNFWTYSVDTKLIDIEWFFYFTYSYNFIQICIESSTGSTHRKYMDEKVFLNHRIVLPEIEEQKEMVKRYKKNSKISRKLAAEIQSQKQLLSQLKQSILQEAIQGKLTADWRAKRALSGAEVEPASELLKRIKTEKAQLIKDKLIKKEKALSPIKAEDIPFELPEGWVWCRLGDICNNITSGSTPSKESFNSTEIPYLKVYNIRNQKIDFDYKPQFILKSVHQTSLKRCILKPNDVVMNIVGPPLGKVAVIPEQYPEWNCNQAIAIFRCIDANVNRFIYQYLCAGLYLNYLHYKGMAGQDNISVTMCKELVIGLPSLSEQQAIVEKVESLIQKCEALEEQIKTNEANAQRLMQAILKEAFEAKQEVVEV